MDVLEDYPLDGLHFDYVRYPAPDYDYSRVANPTRTALQECLASLEGAEQAFCSERCLRLFVESRGKPAGRRMIGMHAPARAAFQRVL